MSSILNNIKVNTISEKTTYAGVSVENVVIKDNVVYSKFSIGEWSYETAFNVHGGNKIGDHQFGTNTATANVWYRMPFTTTITAASWCTFVPAGTGDPTTASSFTLTAGTYLVDLNYASLYAGSNVAIMTTSTLTTSATLPAVILDSLDSYQAGTTNPGQTLSKITGKITVVEPTTYFFMKVISHVNAGYANGLSCGSVMTTACDGRNSRFNHLEIKKLR